MTQNQDDSMDLEEEQYYYEEEEGEDLFGGAAQQQSSSLNASFDASLFRQNMPALSSNNHYELRNATSWDERDRAQEQQQLSIELPDLPPPRSMRKTGRRLSQLEQSTPVRLRFRPPGSSVKKSGKLTPASAKRHKALNKARLRDIIRPSTSAQKESSQRDFVLRDNDCPDTSHLAFSAIKPPKVSLNSLAPAAPNSTLLETTSETTESADTDSSTPFRFTSFPASLPRINNPRTERQQPSCPATIRKRMSFGDNHAVLQHRDNDDGTHNTSLSSIGHYDYSDDDDDDDSTIGTPMARTRLDFSMNHHHSPRVVGNKKDSEKFDLSHPYEQKRMNSFASSLIPPKNIGGGFGEDFPSLPIAETPSRSGIQSKPGTPREVKLHFQLDAAQCSPIPGIPEEDGDTSSKSAFSGRKSALGDRRANSSRDSSISTTGTDKKVSRPMPDMAAFEGESSFRDRSSELSGGSPGSLQRPASPRLLCPPTPIRTPAWASEQAGNSTFKHGLMRYGRQNSLITTKVLATCSPQVLDERASLEHSTLAEEGNSSRDSQEKSASKSKATDDSCDTIVDEDLNSPMKDEEENWLHENRAAHSFKRDSSGSVGPQEGNVVSMANFDVLSTLGRGTFADVFRVRSRVDGHLYAIKRNRRQFRGKRDRDKALAEVKYMQRLQSAGTESKDGNWSYSLYILFFYQAWQEDGHFFCQTELCCRDTCRELVDCMRSQWNLASSRYPSLKRLTLKDPAANDLDGRLFPEHTIWKIAHDVCAGLSHIHTHGLVHFDIKPSNIFLVPHGRLGAMCKIGDFGMAGEIGSSEDGQEGDTRYMPLELLSSEKKHPSADMFSYGMTLLEISASVLFLLPSEGPRWHELRSGRCNNLEVPACRSPELIELIQATLRPDPTKRPSAGMILKHEKVTSAGHTCDEFLRDYLVDIEEFDLKEERRSSTQTHDDQTPRQSGRTICSPSASFLSPSSSILPKPPLMFSPKAS